MSPVPEAFSVGSLSSLNLCSNRDGVWFGTAHFLVALQQWVTLEWCRQWRQGKRVDFMVQWTAMLAGVRPVYDPSVQHQYEGTGACTRATPTAFASRAVPVSAAPPPPSPPPTSWEVLWRPRRPPQYLGQRWALSRHRAPPVVLRYACLLGCEYFVGWGYFLLLDFLIGGAKIKINR